MFYNFAVLIFGGIPFYVLYICADYPYYSCLFAFLALPALLRFSLSNYFKFILVNISVHNNYHNTPLAQWAILS